jgi:lipopolysaccharide transport system permease protein
MNAPFHTPAQVADTQAAHPSPTVSLPLHGDQEEEIVFVAGLDFKGRQRMAAQDLIEGYRLRRLCWTLSWLDIKSRYRGSLLGPLWLTLSTGVMVAALGLLYSTLFKMNLHEYLPFLTLSLVLWNFISALVGDACVAFTQAESMIRSIRMPYSLYAGRIVIRNVMVLAHNIIVIVCVYVILSIWPGVHALEALPALALWLVDAMALGLVLGAFCARFRDIPPIVASIMQIAFFVSPIIWKPELLGTRAHLLPLNPFYSLLEVVRGPLLGTTPSLATWASAFLYSVVLCILTWLLFVRVRGRLAFWV